MNVDAISRIEKEFKTKIITNTKLAGGSDGETYLLISESNNKYIYKTDALSLIEMQQHFYTTYKELPYLPKVLYHNTNFKELVLSYVDQYKEINYNKNDIIEDLTNNFILKYKETSDSKYGFLSDFIQAKSYAEFLIAQITEASVYIKNELSPKDVQNTINLINKVYTKDIFNKKYLLHGDLGFHNIAHSSHKITGIIDPDPIVGHPIYDILFAYVSSPQQISKDSYYSLIQNLEKVLPIYIDDAASYLKIALYKRISSCIKHHPKDLPEYLSLWKILK